MCCGAACAGVTDTSHSSCIVIWVHESATSSHLNLCLHSLHAQNSFFPLLRKSSSNRRLAHARCKHPSQWCLPHRLQLTVSVSGTS